MNSLPGSFYNLATFHACEALVKVPTMFSSEYSNWKMDDTALSRILY